MKKLFSLMVLCFGTFSIFAGVAIDSAQVANGLSIAEQTANTIDPMIIPGIPNQTIWMIIALGISHLLHYLHIKKVLSNPK